MCQCFQMARKFLRWLQSHPPRLSLVHPSHLHSVSSVGKGDEECFLFGICFRAGSLHLSTFPPKKCRGRAGGSTCPALEKGFQTGQVATGLGKASPSSATSPKYPSFEWQKHMPSPPQSPKTTTGVMEVGKAAARLGNGVFPRFGFQSMGTRQKKMGRWRQSCRFITTAAPSWAAMGLFQALHKGAQRPGATMSPRGPCEKEAGIDEDKAGWWGGKKLRRLRPLWDAVGRSSYCKGLPSQSPRPLRGKQGC